MKKVLAEIQALQQKFAARQLGELTSQDVSVLRRALSSYVSDYEGVDSKSFIDHAKALLKKLEG